MWERNRPDIVQQVCGMTARTPHVFDKDDVWGDKLVRGNYTVWWVKIQSPPIGDWRERVEPIDAGVEDDSSQAENEEPTTDTEDTPKI